jgi:hypothetical protein
MRLYEVEYSKEELAQLREDLRREHPHLTEEQLDEIIPAIALGAARLGMAAVRGAGALAKGVGKVGSAVGRGVGKVAKGIGGLANQAGKSAVNFGKKQVIKKVSNNLSLGGRTDDSGSGQQSDPAGELDQMAQANTELQATYQAKVKEIEKSLGDMKKSLNLK